jgi:hypothetical protein
LGFWASAPGLAAGALDDAAGRTSQFVCESSGERYHVWTYAGPGMGAQVVLPDARTGALELTFDGQEPLDLRAADGVLSFITPVPPEAEPVRPSAALAPFAPAEWPGGSPAIGVLDFGEAFPRALSRVTPAEWVQALQASEVLRDAGARIRRISTGADLMAALEAGPESWFAVVNPYGENFPVPEGTEWSAALQAVADYVRRGGCWWETGGYSFYYAIDPAAPAERREHVGPAGCGLLGIRVGGGPDDARPSALQLTEDGRLWLGEVAGELAGARSVVNRAVAAAADGRDQLTLVEGVGGAGFVGGYRLGGWGWLWRVGGFQPEPDVVKPVVVGALGHLYTTPPLPVTVSGVRRLWHAVAVPAP